MNNVMPCTLLPKLTVAASWTNAPYCNQRWGAKLKGIGAWTPGTYALVDCAGKYPPGQVAR